ncbi:hypothetical protein D3C86_1746310 [compost metagenome]
MINRAEQLFVLIDDFQTYQLVPVVLVARQVGQKAPRDTNLITAQKTGFITIIEAFELGDQVLLSGTATDQLYLFHHAVAPKRPVAVIQQVFNRIGKGINLHFAANAVNRKNFADDNQVIRVFWRRVHISQAAALAASFSN